MDNETRADYAEQAVNLFAEITRLRSERNHEDYNTILGDLLCNLRHLCNRKAVNFDTVNHLGQMHYEAETNSEDEVEGGPKAHLDDEGEQMLISRFAGVKSYAQFLHVQDIQIAEAESQPGKPLRKAWRQILRLRKQRKIK